MDKTVDDSETEKILFACVVQTRWAVRLAEPQTSPQILRTCITMTCMFIACGLAKMMSKCKSTLTTGGLILPLLGCQALKRTTIIMHSGFSSVAPQGTPEGVPQVLQVLQGKHPLCPLT